MTKLEHEARRQYAIMADFPDAYIDKIENVAADLLEKSCPKEKRVMISVVIA